MTSINWKLKDLYAFRYVFLVIACIVTFQVSAVEVTYENIKYNVNEDTGAASVKSNQNYNIIKENLVIPDYIEYKGKHYDVTEIEEYAFRSWFKGTLTLGKFITSIGDYAFEGNSELYGSLILPNSVKSIGMGAFVGCTGFTELVLPPSIERIGERAFAECTGLTGALNLPESLTEISERSFAGCTGLESLIIPNSIVDIGMRAFYQCTGLKGALIIPNSVKWIGVGAFEGCYNLESLSLGNSLLDIFSMAFEGCTNLSGSLVIPNSVRSISNMAFKDCRGFRGSLIIGNSVKVIGQQAFYGCSRFTGSLVIPNSVTEIGDDAFRGCSGFSGSLVIPNSITSIQKYTFYGCSGFRDSLIIGDSVTSVERFAFRDTAFDYIILPESLTKIGEGAFDKTTNFILSNPDLYGIHGIECSAIIPPECAQEFYDIFSPKDYLAPLYVPAQSVEAYKVADVWKNFFDIRAIGEILPEEIVLDRSMAQIKINDTLKLAATVYPENVTDKTVTWSSDNEDVATVSEDGTVTALSVGVANITATCGEATASCKVTVNPITAKGITLNVEDLTLLIGQTDKLIATVLPENTTDKSITWSSDNERVASVNEEGVVTALSVGVANITATCGEVTTTCKVTVNPITAKGITLNVEDLTLLIGQTDKLIATVLPENTTDKSITWSSDNERVASVNEEGVVTALSVGVANIKATCGEATASCKVTVNPIIAEGITLNVESLTLFIGQTHKLIATVLPENTTDKSITWSSDNERVASVNEEGVVTTLSVGVANITATCGDASASCKVTANPITAEGITLNVEDLTLLIGQTDKLTATVLPENTTDKSITWSSDNEGVASVNEEGVVTALSVGVANITATCGDASASCKVTVNPIIAEGITLNVESLTLLIGQTDKLTATVFPENTTDKSITWSSDNEGVASVNEEGVVSALSVGVANITATCGDASASCKVTVNPIIAEGISLNAEDLTLLIGQSDKLTATVLPENTTDKSITWSSDKETVALVNEEGIVTAISVGRANITATCGETTATCKVTVKANRVEAETVEINIEEMILWTGQSDTLTATVYPENTTDKLINWSSENNNVATVDRAGIVTAIAPGNTTITAMCGDAKGYCKVTVKDRPVTPSELLRKGDGASCTFIAMMPVNDSILEEEGYRYVYGYTDVKGNEHILTTNNLRYCHTTPEIYNNDENDFWVFSYRKGTEGEIVASQYRHLNGAVSEGADISMLESYLKAMNHSQNLSNWIIPTQLGAKVSYIYGESSQLMVNTLTGSLVCKFDYRAGCLVNEQITREELPAGLYIFTVSAGENRITKKIIIR